MATKSTRRSTTTSSQSSSFVSSFTSPFAGARSPPSPGRRSRLQEKEELGNLNERLAGYIDKVRSLETENSRLLVQVRSFEETSTREVTNIKKLYEQELKDARKLLDDLGKDKAKLQIELSAAKAELKELRDKYNKRDREASSLEKKLAAAEVEIADLRAKLFDVTQKKQNLENENKNLKADNATLEKQLNISKKELENETLIRVDLENKIQSLSETIKFNDSLHQEQMNETRSRAEMSITEVDGRYKQEYEQRLTEAVKEMRETQRYQIQLNREDCNNKWEKSLADLRVAAERNLSAAASAQEEVTTLRRKVDEVGQQCTKLTSENDMLRKRVKELENQLAHEIADHQREREMHVEERKHLTKSIEDHVREYAELMDIKTALDMEIDSYKKMIEEEEVRLNISSQSESSMTTPSRRTPARATPTRSGKRKRVSYEGLQSQAMESGKYAVSKTATGVIDISEADDDGKYIQVKNVSGKDQTLAGWQLKHTAGDMETVFKLPRSVNLKPNQTCTIWSTDGDGPHSPPNDIVMKGQKWYLADNMTTLLLNKDGEEMARCDSSLSMLRTFQAGPSSSFGSEGDPQQREKCAIM